VWGRKDVNACGIICQIELSKGCDAIGWMVKCATSILKAWVEIVVSPGYKASVVRSQPPSPPLTPFVITDSTMRLPIILSALLAPFSILASPISPPILHLHPRQQSRPTKPAPCTRLFNTTTATTQVRAAAFANAFIYDKNITEAFTYIAQDYINHNPAAQNGFDSAWNILSPVWGGQSITPLRTAFKSPQSWLNYRTESFGEVVDRYRWDGGCIAEHWDQGEKFPTTM
jgi:predicted SnoaL-like aldol condensation-catalyzing enzyme